MSREELLALIDTLEPENTDIAQALAFIRLVVSNNPMKTAEQIAKRPDVQQALKVIADWVAQVENVVAEMVPLVAGGAVVAKDIGGTLDQLEADVQVSVPNVAEWRTEENPPAPWAARIMLRMSWLVDWLKKTLLNTTVAPYKRRMSRLAPNTCKYCAGLHGTVQATGTSFAPAAKKLGWKRVYGGLYTPPLHPNCQCWIEPVWQAEYDLLTDT